MNWLPFFYYIAFLIIAVGYRAYRVWQISGVNALTVYHTEGVHGLASNLFRVTFIGIAIVTALNILPTTRAMLTSLPWAFYATAQYFGWGLLFGALCLVIVAQVQMGSAWRIGVDYGQKTELITSGIFQYSRNPIFLGIRICFLGLLLVMPNAWMLMLVVLGDAMIQIQVRLEEDYLQTTFGDTYKAYALSTRRWI